ncbi:hypothetical protein Gorai_019393 [Gossypium raimondii]|uniref:Uncharacterized protein n=1 Tax=Gossypium raimondii TaxID=29730 RepID=A0A7J8PN72_GOSRA|nr:hypothetical protein [Gossypium raimondii]
MSTSGNNEDCVACLTSGRNTKKVWFKENEDNITEMIVDLLSGLPGYLYNKKILEEIEGMIEKGSVAVEPMIGGLVKEATKFGPWMIVERWSRQNLKDSHKSTAKISNGDENGSRFKALPLTTRVKVIWSELKKRVWIRRAIDAILGLRQSENLDFGLGGSLNSQFGEKKDTMADLSGVNFRKGNFNKLIKHDENGKGQRLLGWSLKKGVWIRWAIGAILGLGAGFLALEKRLLLLGQFLEAMASLMATSKMVNSLSDLIGKSFSIHEKNLANNNVGYLHNIEDCMENFEKGSNFTGGFQLNATLHFNPTFEGMVETGAKDLVNSTFCLSFSKVPGSIGKGTSVQKGREYNWEFRPNIVGCLRRESVVVG